MMNEMLSTMTREYQELGRYVSSPSASPPPLEVHLSDPSPSSDRTRRWSVREAMRKWR